MLHVSLGFNLSMFNFISASYGLRAPLLITKNNYEFGNLTQSEKNNKNTKVIDW